MTTTLTALDHATLAEARRLDAMLEGAINAGTIPPRPDYLTQNAAWRAWFDTHVRCMGSLDRGGRCYMQREMPGTMCKGCRKLARSEVKVDPMTWSKLAASLPNPFDPKTTTAQNQASLAALGVTMSTQPIEAEQPKRVRKARAL